MCNLGKHLKIDHKLQYQAYDPGVPRFSSAPVPAEMVACIDVLEHIEPEYLNGVLDDLARLTESVLFASVHTGPAIKVLSDGRNAHLTQQPLNWWLPEFMDRFELQTVQTTSEHGFFIVGLAKSRLETANGERIL